MTDEEMFQQLTELPPSKREQCLLTNAMDSEQRKRVVALLAAHEQPDSLLAADDMPSTIQGSSRVVPGVSIGPYKLREQIGEGGMGVVYIAEQNQPVKRKVALKLIKIGMDTKDVTARFEAERQALAMMDHPNIARVLDAGSSEHGRPYFVIANTACQPSVPGPPMGGSGSPLEDGISLGCVHGIPAADSATRIVSLRSSLKSTSSRTGSSPVPTAVSPPTNATTLVSVLCRQALGWR